MHIVCPQGMRATIWPFSKQIGHCDCVPIALGAACPLAFSSAPSSTSDHDTSTMNLYL